MYPYGQYPYDWRDRYGRASPWHRGRGRDPWDHLSPHRPRRRDPDWDYGYGPSPWDLQDYYQNHIPWHAYDRPSPTYNNYFYQNSDNYYPLLDAMSELRSNMDIVPEIYRMMQQMQQYMSYQPMQPMYPAYQMYPMGMIPTPMPVMGHIGAFDRRNAYYDDYGGRRRGRTRGRGLYGAIGPIEGGLALGWR